MRPPVAARIAGATAATVLAATGCSTDGLNFRAGDELRITSPCEECASTTPLQLRWRAPMLPAGAEGYAVFVDRIPPRPGQAVDVTDQVGVHYAATPELDLARLPPRNGVTSSERNRHEITVVFVDAAQRRVTESYDFVRFEVTR